MRRLLAGLACLAAASLLAAPAGAQGTIKIGLILPYSGQFADTATQMDNGIKLYLAQKGETVARRGSRSFARIPAAPRRRSPNGSRRNSWCATVSIFLRASS